MGKKGLPPNPVLRCFHSSMKTREIIPSNAPAHKGYLPKLFVKMLTVQKISQKESQEVNFWYERMHRKHGRHIYNNGYKTKIKYEQ